MLAYWDSELHCRYANEAYQTWFGRSAEAMEGIHMRDLLGPIFELNTRYIYSALEGTPQEFERQIVLPDGSMRESLATYTPDVVDGVVRGFVAHVVDVTEVKARLNRLRAADEAVRMEEAERRSAARVKSIVGKLRVGLLVQGPKAEIEMSNPAALTLLGLTEAQLLGTSSFDPTWNVVHPDGRPFPGDEHPVPRAIATRAPVRDVVMGVYRPRLRDRVWLLVDADPQLDEHGAVAEVICTFVNITERLKMQQQLEQANKLESVGRLAGGVAHDFNNILTIINSASDLAYQHVADADAVRKELAEIRKASDRAASLTRQLLTFSRQQMFVPTVLQLDSVLIEMRSEIRRAVDARINVRIDTNAPGVLMRTDRAQLELMLMSLVENAMDAMPEGGTLTISTIEGRRNGTSIAAGDAAMNVPGDRGVLLRIADTGVGMDEVTRERAFDPFFTTKHSASTIGLGLATVYGIVEQSGGTISVDSEPQLGTTFTVWLPSVSRVVPAAVESVTPSVVHDAETILIVEDEDAVRRLLTRMLRGAGYGVVAAASAEEALAIVEQDDRRIDLMLTDVVMPGMNGRELAIRVAAERPECAILFTSGFTDDSVLREGVFQHGASFIAKPYTREAITQKVRDALDGPRETAAILLR